MGGPASATTTIDTDFNTTAVSVTPDTADVAAATSIGFVLLPISNIVTDNTGIILFGTLPVLTNPAPVGVGQSLTLRWTTAKGVFTDALTEMTVAGIPNTSLTIIATGNISGPAGFDPAASEMTFIFGQKNGGYTIQWHGNHRPYRRRSGTVDMGDGALGLRRTGDFRMAARRPRASSDLIGTQKTRGTRGPAAFILGVPGVSASDRSEQRASSKGGRFPGARSRRPQRALANIAWLPDFAAARTPLAPA